MFLRKTFRQLRQYVPGGRCVCLAINDAERDLGRQHPEESWRGIVTENILTLPLRLGQINTQEAHFLSQLVGEAAGTGPLIEIGTLFGFSTRIMAARKPPDQPLITVDKFCWNPFGLSPDQHYRITRQILDDAVAHLNVRMVRQGKADFYESYEGEPPALFFADAIHTYEETKRDIEWARQRDAGIVCGHDYDEREWPGVVQAVQESGGPKRLVGTLWRL